MILRARPIISIILPSYNRANYIGETIDSCLAQTLEDFELIIVDDCSSDNSVEIIETYAKNDKRIKLIKNTENKKLPATLNIGFKEASGKYFTWISDDNLFHPNALEKMTKHLEAVPEIGLVYADYTLINADSKIGSRIYQEEPEFLPIRDCVGACFLYKAEIAKKTGEYDTGLFLIEDYEYWLRMGLIAKFFHIKESLYFYRVHKASLTATRKDEIRKAKIALKKIYSVQYSVPKEIQPISDLYSWFIGDKTLKSYISLLSVIISHPIITISYILKNWRRL